MRKKSRTNKGPKTQNFQPYKVITLRKEEIKYKEE